MNGSKYSIRRIISLFLAVMTMGFLFSACGRAPHDTPYTLRVPDDGTGERQWNVQLNYNSAVSYEIRPAQDGYADVVFTGLKKGSAQAKVYRTREGTNVWKADGVYALELRVDARKNVTQSDPPYGAYSVRLNGDVTGAEWSVECDERIVRWTEDREYPKKSSDEDGMQDFKQIYTFTGRCPGATRVRICVDYPWAEGAGVTREDFWLLVDDEYRVSLLEPTEFTSFRISEQDTSAIHDVYEATRTQDGVQLLHYDALYSWSDETHDYAETRENETAINGGEALYMYLAGLVQTNRVPDWDGFQGANPPHVLDGTMFEFEAVLADGTTVRASGSNNFPKHYREFWNGVRAIVAANEQTG